MATNKKNKLQIFMERYGIGEKGPVQKQIESDPYLKWINSGMRATDYTPEIAAAKRRFIEKQQGAKQQPTYRDTGNVVRTETIEDTAPSSMGTLSTSRSRQVTPDGMGGYGRGGLFSPDRVDSSTSNMVEPSSRGLSGVQAASDFFNFFAKPDSVTRDLPANEANLAMDVANTYFSGELPMPKWRVKDAPSKSLGTDRLGKPIMSREEFDANIEANLENLRFRRRFPEQGPPPAHLGGFEGTGEFAGIPTVAQPNVIIPSVTPIDPELAYRQRQAQAPLRSQVLNELIAQGRVDPRQVGNPYVDRMIDMEIAKIQESSGYDTPSSQRRLFDTRADAGNPFNTAVEQARQRYDALNPVRSEYDIATGTQNAAPVTNYGQPAFPYIGTSGAGGEEMSRAMDAMPPEPPAIVQEAPTEATDFRQRLGAGFGGGSGADIEASRAQLVEPQFSKRFIGYLQKVEGLKTDTGKTPFRYKSAEGGNDTVGIGHKLTDAEVKSGKVYGYDLKTLTKEQAQDILQKDLAKTKSVLSKNLTNKYKKSFEDLTPKQQEMLLDLQFNVKDSGKGGGILEFPKFTEALLKNDLETMRKEYKRYYTDPETKKNVSLGRNKDFFNTYLK
jgi:hypothetical protein